jgi:hypothetical protein
MKNCPKCGYTNDDSRDICMGILCSHDFRKKDLQGNAAATAATGAIRSKLYPEGTKFPARYDLMFRNAAGMRRLAETWGEGNEKYGPDNWMKGFPATVMVSHALEHIRLYLAGDTSEDHLAHCAWNVLALCWVEENKPDLIDITFPAQSVTGEEFQYPQAEYRDALKDAVTYMHNDGLRNAALEYHRAILEAMVNKKPCPVLPDDLLPF